MVELAACRGKKRRRRPSGRGNRRRRLRLRALRHGGRRRRSRFSRRDDLRFEHVICPNCGQQNPAGFRLGGMCGTPLTAPEPVREERKVVTVLFADLVGFTSRSEQLDPEDVRALLAPYWQRLREELERFGGTVEKFIGDAVVALFGAPVAHKDGASGGAAHAPRARRRAPRRTRGAARHVTVRRCRLEPRRHAGAPLARRRAGDVLDLLVVFDPSALPFETRKPRCNRLLECRVRHRRRRVASRRQHSAVR